MKFARKHRDTYIYFKYYFIITLKELNSDPTNARSRGSGYRTTVVFLFIICYHVSIGSSINAEQQSLQERRVYHDAHCRPETSAHKNAEREASH